MGIEVTLAKIGHLLRHSRVVQIQAEVCTADESGEQRLIELKDLIATHRDRIRDTQHTWRDNPDVAVAVAPFVNGSPHEWFAKLIRMVNGASDEAWAHGLASRYSEADCLKTAAKLKRYRRAIEQRAHTIEDAIAALRREATEPSLLPVVESPKPLAESATKTKSIKGKRVSVNAVVLDLFQNHPESIGWPLRKLAQATGCSRTAISECKAYTQAKLVKAEAKIDRLGKQSSYRGRDGKKRSVRPDE
jgi:hypothetical protein